jgi:phosphoinositide-3-kinase regulatory subunit 4
MLLPLLITFLNDRDPTLRAAFFEGIGGVCAFVGRASLQAFVLPCIMQVRARV